MNYAEEDLLPLSALAHLAFCERRAALVHIEQLWEENRFTVEGRHLHEKVHEAGPEVRDGVRIARGVRLHSLRLGLVGQADVVEFHECGTKEGEAFRQPFPVEYKRGRPKPDQCDAVQLCAQAMCLEEMLNIAVPRGALYYGQPRRRQEVLIDEALRGQTETLAARMHALFGTGVTPAAQYEKKCDRCSLYEICLPKVAGQHKDTRRYLEDLWNEHVGA